MNKIYALKFAEEALAEYPVNTGKLRASLEACKEALKHPAQHKWSADGERCVKCGDKDWMGGSCSIADEQPAQGIELEWYQKGWDDAKREGISKTETTTATIKESLNVEPAQEPVAWIDEEKKIIYWHNTHEIDDFHGFTRTTAVYKHPAPQPAQEPVAWRNPNDNDRRHAFMWNTDARDKEKYTVALYTHPAPSCSCKDKK